MFATDSLWKSLAAVLLVGASCTTQAADIKPTGASIEFATGNATQMLRVGLQQDWEQAWFQSGDMQLSGYWDLTYARWKGNRYKNIVGAWQRFDDVGLTPVFRYQAKNKQGWYAEGGIGVHYLGDRYDNFGRQMSTKFEFGDHIGAGYVFDNGMDLGLKIQHFSNGGFKKPNGGVNFFEAKLGFRF